MKTPYLVAYEYGQGAVWAVINARNEEEIREKYPMVVVRHPPPVWLTTEDYDRISSTLTVDIDEPAGDWLLAAQQEER